MAVDKDTFNLALVSELIQVTVLDDGLPVTEKKSITITLVRVVGGASDDILITEATLVIPVEQGVFLCICVCVCVHL